MVAVLTEIINILTGGLVAIGQAMGSALSSMVTAIFLTGSGTTESPYALSVFGGITIVFAGIGLGLALTRWVLNFCTSLGNRNR